eukprot:2349554-Ditylum_brightwellii.AAC.1
MMKQASMEQLSVAGGTLSRTGKKYLSHYMGGEDDRKKVEKRRRMGLYTAFGWRSLETKLIAELFVNCIKKAGVWACVPWDKAFTLFAQL